MWREEGLEKYGQDRITHWISISTDKIKYRTAMSSFLFKKNWRLAWESAQNHWITCRGHLSSCCSTSVLNYLLLCHTTARQYSSESSKGAFPFSHVQGQDSALGVDMQRTPKPNMKKLGWERTEQTSASKQLHHNNRLKIETLNKPEIDDILNCWTS